MTTNEAVSRRLDVCVVSGEFMGPVQGGGIATFYTTLAETLAETGHRLTLLYTRGRVSEKRSIHYWIDSYRERGIRLVPLPEPSELPQLVGNAPSSGFASSTRTSASYRTYLWLRKHAFDLVHVPEIRGYAYYAMVAKRQGIAFESTTFVVGTRGGSSWLKLAAREYLRLPDDLELDFMERRSVALADVVLSPNRFLLRWLAERGWQIPERRVVLQNILRKEVRRLSSRDDSPRDGKTTREPNAVREVVFFGKLAELKGLVLFCDALDRLSTLSDTKELRVTFLGRDDHVQGMSGSEYVRSRATRWPFSWQIVSDRDPSSAMEYLARPSVLAVVPSLLDNSPNTVLECLGAKVPLIASEVGGIPELVHEQDRSSVLFPLRPERLAEKLASAVREGVKPARPANDPEENEREWIAWHDEIASAASLVPAQKTAPALSKPRVTVCITSRSSEGRSQSALLSVDAQDYPSYCVVLAESNAGRRGEGSVAEDAAPERERKHVQLETGCSVGAALNRAAGDARGRYVLFLDDGDSLRPNALSVLVNVAEHTNADVVTSFVDYVSGAGDAEGNASRPSGDVLDSRRLVLGAASCLGLFRNVFGGNVFLVRTRSFVSIGGFSEEQEDLEACSWEFYARSVLMGFDLQVVPEALIRSQIKTAPAAPQQSEQDGSAAVKPYLDVVPGALRGLVASIGNRHRTVERLRSAMERLQQTKPDASNAMVIAARALRELGQVQVATTVLSKASRLARASESTESHCECLLAESDVWCELGNAERARQALDWAEATARQLADDELLARCLLSRARLEASLGSADEAERRIRDGLQAAGPRGVRSSLASRLLSSADVLRRLGRPKDASLAVQQALAHAREEGDHELTARALVETGKESAREQPESAVRTLLTALKSAKQTGDMRLLSSTLLDVGESLCVAGQSTLAKDVLGSCLQVSEQTGAEATFLRARDRLATLR